ncbi:MAG: ATP-binding protein [SAR324 cluster bacterium]|nr:ATP-binding protein [SAR324 cluster bacterium]MBF0352169.1 ATP-binding protein [SAR324 cluster bacterium]
MLSVHLFSFGYRRSGIPQDPNGNGGGFVFDCRCLPNPGQLDAFRDLTGKQTEVQEWLKQQDRFHLFAGQCLALIEQSIEFYQKRGFEHLMVSFGCTGGQHRSVFLSEWTYSRLLQHEIHVDLVHTEMNHWPGNQNV